MWLLCLNDPRLNRQFLMKPRYQIFPLLPAIVIGAVLGAVALIGLLRFPFIIFQAMSGGLSEALSSVFDDAFFTPWGAIGAVVGGTLAWRRFRARPAAEAQDSGQAAVNPEGAGDGSKSRRIFHPGEAMLAWGLVFLAVTAAVRYAVMGHFLIVLPSPFAAVLLAFGVIRSRNRSATVGRQFAGFGLVLLGLGALGVAAFMGASLSGQLAFHAHRPTAPVPNLWDWAWFAGSCLIPALLMGPGICFWTNWSSRRRFRWCVILLAFPLATLLLHRILVARGFLAVDA
jgi:hypothetical protein